MKKINPGKKLNLDIRVNNFSEAQEKLGIKNITEYMKYLGDKHKYDRINKLKENESKLKNHISKIKGHDVKLTKSNIFWIEDILDRYLYELQHKITIAIEKGRDDYLDYAESTIQQARMVARMCEKLKIYAQYYKFKEDEKKYRRPGKRTFSIMDVQDAPGYIKDARRKLTKNMKQIKKKRNLIQKRFLLKVVN